MTSDSLVQIVLNKVQSQLALRGIHLLLKSPFWLWQTIKYDKLKYFFAWLKTDILQQTYQQADIRMRSNGLRQLVDDKCFAS